MADQKTNDQKSANPVAPEAISHKAAYPPVKRRRYSRLGPVMIACIIVLIGVIQWLAPYTDHQISNMATAGLLFACLVIANIWWFRNVRSVAIRAFLPAVCVLLPVTGLFLYQPVGVSGELIPIFRYRFASPKDLQSATELSSDNLGPNDQSQLTLTENFNTGFLGPDRNGKFSSRLFSKDWTSKPPKQLWKQPIGAGLAGFATANVRLTNDKLMPIGITLEQRGQDEAVTCYDLDSGKLLWVAMHESYHSHPLGDVGPRSTPSIAASGLVYAQGATGHVWCLNALDGSLVWERDLLEIAGIDQDTAEQDVTWGRAASPLLVDDLVVLPLGGSNNSPEGIHTLIALDASTGEERWRGGDYQISYASPVLATLDGVRQIVSVNQDFVSGHKIYTGEQLWSYSWPGVSNGGASCTNPTIVGSDQVLLSKGYGGGAMLLEVKSSDIENQFSVQELWADMRLLKTKFTNPVVVDNFAYGISDGTLECVSLVDGERRWRQSRSTRFGHGHIIVVEDVIVGSTEDGEIVLVDSNPENYVELGRFRAVDGKTWNPPALSGNKLLVRNGNEMSFWDLGSDQRESARHE